MTSSCCLSGKLHTGSPTGSFEQISGRKTYVALPQSGSKAKTLVYITDIFGVDLPNHQLLADTYADAGFHVLIPDIFDGDALPADFLDTVEPKLAVREQLSVVQKGVNTASTMSTLGPWMIKHREAVSKPIIDDFIATIRKDSNVQKVGIVGFCWGGRHAILQAHPGSQVDAAVALHPSGCTPADFEPISKPLSLGFGDEDSVTPISAVHTIIDVLAKKTDVPHEVRIYEKQIHGFAVRGDHSSDKDKEAMDEAVKQTVEWFQKYL